MSASPPRRPPGPPPPRAPPIGTEDWNDEVVG
jgi:hypothetical protein